jgi:hypothetical protein
MLRKTIDFCESLLMNKPLWRLIEQEGRKKDQRHLHHPPAPPHDK